MIILFTFYYLAISENESDPKPIIRPPVKYKVFQPGSTFNLTCETTKSIRNVTWQTPDSRNSTLSLPINKKETNSKTTWTESRKNSIIIATLTVFTATYADTGYYTCKSAVNDDVFVKQYIFIQGKIQIVAFNEPKLQWMKTFLNFIDLNSLLTFTFHPYRIEPFLGFSKLHYLEYDRDIIINAFYLSPVVVRIILTSPFVGVVLNQISPNGRILQQVIYTL